VSRKRSEAKRREWRNGGSQGVAEIQETPTHREEIDTRDLFLRITRARKKESRNKEDRSRKAGRQEKKEQEGRKRRSRKAGRQEKKEQESRAARDRA
jgi:hypothetical protein